MIDANYMTLTFSESLAMSGVAFDAITHAMIIKQQIREREREREQVQRNDKP